MPGAAADTRRVLKQIAAGISPDSYVNIMAQYYPCHRAGEFPEISRRPSAAEYEEAVSYALSLGLTRASRH
ncbi:MAG: hypothetical protein A4E61_01773 [Syntrophorhabdus sp. PtaB.Bin184]|nr:MAG: hypothetical protein A4E61_01773 [Syntrophorhabdus sp. PtaB.Bin184]